MMSLRSGLAFLGVAALVGCDVPTEAPSVEQRWILPIADVSISVGEFLPDGVGLAGELFSITVDSFAAESTLAELCISCADGPGPAPAFQGAFSGSQPFPENVTAAILETGSVAVVVQNGFSFDPTEGGGRVVITITDGPGGKVLGQATISSGMAPGSTVTRGITLAGGPMEPILMASAEVTSPGGQTATIDTSEKLIMGVEATAIQPSFVTVQVANRAVDIAPADLDVADIDETISDAIQSGGLRLDITNPFAAAMTVALVVTYPGGTLSRTVDIEGTAVSTASVSYTGDEFRLFLGKEGVTLTGTGSVSSAARPTTVRTDQQLVMEATIDLTLVIG